MEERPQIELVTVFHRDTRHREVHQRTFVTSGYRVKRVLPWAMSKWTKHIVTFNEEEDEDTLVEEGPQIERGTVSPRDTRHSEAHPRSIRDKQIPREACFDLGDVKVEMKRRMKSLLWRKDLKLNAARCLPGTHATVRLTQKAFVTSGSRVKRDLTWAMSKRRKIL